MKILLIPYLAAYLAASTQVEVHYMPVGAKVYLLTGEEGRGFTLGEYKLLLQMDADLWNLTQQVDMFRDLGEQYKLVTKQKDAIILSLKKDKEILRTRSLRLEEKWQESEEARVNAEGGALLPWIVAAIGAGIGIAGVCMFIGTQVK